MAWIAVTFDMATVAPLELDGERDATEPAQPAAGDAPPARDIPALVPPERGGHNPTTGPFTAARLDRRHAGRSCPPAGRCRAAEVAGKRAELDGRCALGWHELVEDWWTLLAPAERVLTEDLTAFTEEHSARMLPFTTLARVGENDLHQQRRLAELKRSAARACATSRR
jgi:hypothetical protein